MLRNACPLLVDACLLAFVSAVSIANAQAPAYPATKKGDVVDDYHGTKVADPYRWLEDLGSADTKAWIDAENAVTLPYLERLPQRAALVERLTQFWNYPRTTFRCARPARSSTGRTPDCRSRRRCIGAPR